MVDGYYPGGYGSMEWTQPPFCLADAYAAARKWPKSDEITASAAFIAATTPW